MDNRSRGRCQAQVKTIQKVLIMAEIPVFWYSINKPLEGRLCIDTDNFFHLYIWERGEKRGEEIFDNWVDLLKAFADRIELGYTQKLNSAISHELWYERSRERVRRGPSKIAQMPKNTYAIKIRGVHASFLYTHTLTTTDGDSPEQTIVTPVPVGGAYPVRKPNIERKRIKEKRVHVPDIKGTNKK